MPRLPAPSAPPLQPTRSTERVVWLDVLRGVALLGIAVVNALLIGRPEPPAGGWAGVDRAALALVRFLFEGKFYALFALLFGVGFGLQLERLAARGGAARPFYVRRMGTLMALGLAHGLLLWSGDILFAYGLLGLGLLAFVGVPERSLVLAGAVVLAVPAAAYAAVAALAAVAPEHVPPALLPPALGTAEASAEVYRSGSWGAIARHRAGTLAEVYAGVLAYGWTVFALFLAGLWASGRGLVRNTSRHRPFFRRLAVAGLAVGLPLNGAYVALAGPADGPAAWAGQAALALGAPALGLAYAAAAGLAEREGRWTRPFAAAGRMALTNYLLQSVVLTTLFYGYGLGLLGRVGPAALAGVAAAVFAGEAALSAWWLRRFRFGPAEWAWRWATYGPRPPFRLRAEAEPPLAGGVRAAGPPP